MAKTLADILGLSEINKKLDRIDNKIDKILLDPRYIDADLEKAIQEISRRALAIDKKVPDQSTTTKRKK